MGRPWLYHSPEEKAAANHTKSKHHYTRYGISQTDADAYLIIYRDKLEINLCWRKVYRKQKKTSLVSSTSFFWIIFWHNYRPIELLPSLGEIKRVLLRQESALAAWLERADSAERRLDKILGRIDPVPFVDQICKTYLQEKSLPCLEAQVSSLVRLQKSLYKYQNKIYSLTGVGPEHKRMDALVGHIRTAVTLAEEVSCFAMLGAKRGVLCVCRQRVYVPECPSVSVMFFTTDRKYKDYSNKYVQVAEVRDSLRHRFWYMSSESPEYQKKSVINKDIHYKTHTENRAGKRAERADLIGSPPGDYLQPRRTESKTPWHIQDWSWQMSIYHNNCVAHHTSWSGGQIPNLWHFFLSESRVLPMLPIFYLDTTLLSSTETCIPLRNCIA